MNDFVIRLIDSFIGGRKASCSGATIRGEIGTAFDASLPGIGMKYRCAFNLLTNR